MKVSAASVAALLIPAISARFVEENEPNHVRLSPNAVPEGVEKFHIELAPGKTVWVTEEEKWELKKNGRRFMDITDHADLASLRATTAKAKVKFPKKVQLQDDIHPLLANLSTAPIQENLKKFTSFHTRYYKSDYGKQSSQWLLEKVKSYAEGTAAASKSKSKVTVEHFVHPWGQNSIIARIPGKTNRTVVLGAHQDSINLWLPSVLPAPGADDDGSGTVTILEAFRVLQSVGDLVAGKAENTVEFHWYSAEEGGLLGSQAIFSEYAKKGVDVIAMLQQDMTGFVQRTLDAGKPESFGVMVDYVDADLTDFLKKIIVEYTNIPFVETKCGYACSDHASASKAGYASGMVTEAAFEYTDNKIHTVDDLIKYLSFEHMLQHAKLTFALAYELAFTDLEKTKDAADDLLGGEL